MRQLWQYKTCFFIVWIFCAFTPGNAIAQPEEIQSSPEQTQTSLAPQPDAAPPAEARQQARKAIAGLRASSAVLGSFVERSAAEYGPEGLTAPFLLGVSGARWLASLTLLILILVFTGLMIRSIRIFAGRIADGNEQTWPRMLLSATRKPLALMIWTYGIYYSLGLIVGVNEAEADRWAPGRILGGLTYAGLMIAIFWLIFRVIRGTEHKMLAWAERSQGVLDNVLVPVVGTALRLLVPAVALFLLLGAVILPAPIEWLSTKILAMFLIASVAYVIIRATTLSERALLRVHRIDVADNLRARQIYTQTSVIRRIVIVSSIFLAAACMLMLFEPVRQLGTSILASAGVAGVVLGLAAQKTLSNLFAGIQIAISQPIRIDDVVIVEGEWGRVEDITLTFVTICIWDLRRLVLPINYFIEKPFQNWTRNSAKLLNSIFIYADYTLPVEPLRQELKRLLDANPRWSQETWGLQVTDATPQTIQIRCLMSSSDAPSGWDLKCEIREGLVSFIRENFPESLPRIRAEVQQDLPLTDPHLGNDPKERVDAFEKSGPPS